MTSTSPVVVVTGANRNPGIGFEIVRALGHKMSAQAAVVLTARKEEMGKPAVETLLSEGLTNVVFHQLDIADESSVKALFVYIQREFGGLDVLVNNAGLSFPMQDTTPFPDQARQTIDANYLGTKRMIDTLRSLIRPKGRIIGITSTAGQLNSSWSESLQARISHADLTIEDLDNLAEEFVAAAAEGRHREAGFPGSAYGTSKALLNHLHRVIGRDMPADQGLIVAVCPGLCRTYMATGRGTLMSNVLWAASFFVGSSAAGGADTPVWLACEVPEEDFPKYQGKFMKGRNVISY